MKAGTSSGTNWCNVPFDGRRTTSCAAVTVPEVSSIGKPSGRIRSTSGRSESTSPTLAPWAQMSGPAGRSSVAMPRRSEIRSGSSFPRRSRVAKSAPANGAASRVAR